MITMDLKFSISVTSVDHRLSQGCFPVDKAQLTRLRAFKKGPHGPYDVSFDNDVSNDFALCHSTLSDSNKHFELGRALLDFVPSLQWNLESKGRKGVVIAQYILNFHALTE